MALCIEEEDNHSLLKLVKKVLFPQLVDITLPYTQTIIDHLYESNESNPSIDT